MGSTGFYWVSLGFTGFYWGFLSFTGIDRFLLALTGFYRIFTRLDWVLLCMSWDYSTLITGFYGNYRVLPGFTRLDWLLLGFS